MPWQLLDLHSLPLLPRPKMQLPLAPSAPAFPFTNAGELCSCPAVLQSEAQSCVREVVADLAVHTDPSRELGPSQVEPLAGLPLVGKHWWSWQDDKISFKQSWKAEENLRRIPAPVLGVRLFSLSQCAGSGPEVKGVAADKKQS